MYTILGRPNCPFCNNAQEELDARGVSYTYIDVRDTPWVRTLCIKAGIATVPQIFAPDGSYIGGWDDLKQKE